MSNLRDELEAIRKQFGKLTPQLVVDQARGEGHPLHSYFEWDNEAAGEAWRRVQAHRLITKLRVTYKEPDEKSPGKSVRQYHAIRGDDEREYVYEPAEKVAADPFLTQLVLRDMEREWQQLKRRYDQFDEFWRMVRRDVGDEAA